ncbi:restriction endonuclease [Sulfurimonas sp.]|uniref:restriction endonuclease n=1 Tax=Sulfurimonas sp. TaxID=2022749 RepID=UPI003D116685
MPVLDFKEIPEAHIASGKQDTFELFARDFLEYVGYKIISEPDRGADGGKDIIVEEIRIGVGGETKIRWLVSCKHQAHSGKSVSPNIELNIRDRIETHSCKGFIGFYSTLASTGLSTILESIEEVQVFDCEKIEKKLLNSPEGKELARRYFPMSLKEFERENPEPVKLFIDEASLKCMVCGKELLTADETSSIITSWQKTDEEGKLVVKEFFWSCKGHCDDVISYSFRQKDPNFEYIDQWEDISDVMIPTVYLKWIMSTLNQQKSGAIYSDKAFENIKEFLLQTFHYVARHLTTKEEKRLNSLYMIPTYLGGMGD